jgi:protein SCO1
MKTLFLIFALQIAFLAGAGERKPACCVTNSGFAAGEALTGGASAVSPPAFSDKSLYQLDSVWNSADGGQVKLAELKGKPQVVTMFFARCELACPVLIHDVKRIEAALPPELRDKVGFVLVSFDSERDTPEVLRAYRHQQELNASTWTLLQGKSDDVLELAALLGIKFKKDPQGQFAHSNIITVLNPAGEIVNQLNGLNLDVAPAVGAIKRTFD